MFRTDHNRVVLATTLPGEQKPRTNFTAYEFRSRSTGLVLIHPLVVMCAELVRRDLNEFIRPGIQVIITHGLRMPADEMRLVERYGWLDEGGRVSRNSRHKPENGACAIDFYAWDVVECERVLQTYVERIAMDWFDWTKTYNDGTIHGDLRDGGKHVIEEVRRYA